MKRPGLKEIRILNKFVIETHGYLICILEIACEKMQDNSKNEEKGKKKLRYEMRC